MPVDVPVAAPSFVRDIPAQRVCFGAGMSRTVAAEVELAGWRRALLLCTRERREPVGELVRLLGVRAVGVFDAAQRHTPVEVTRSATELALAARCDCLVSVGGGSTTGLGKAIAARTALPLLAVPTTYAGSEVTDVLGETEAGTKRTRREPLARPRVVVYDPDLLASLPSSVAADSLMNAAAHAVEAAYARSLDPITVALSEAAVRQLAVALSGLAAGGLDAPGRASALTGAWLGGCSLAAATMGLHHRLCHLLGGALDAPHAPTHAALLPHVLAFNASAAPTAMGALVRALGTGDPAGELQSLGQAAGATAALRDVGVDRSRLPALAEAAAAGRDDHPRRADATELLTLLDAAWSGADAHG